MKKREQRLVSFTENSVELEQVSHDLKSGWSMVSLMKNGSYYAGIIEKLSEEEQEEGVVFIPPRKKFQIIS